LTTPSQAVALAQLLQALDNPLNFHRIDLRGVVGQGEAEGQLPVLPAPDLVALGVVHPQALAFQVEPHGIERRHLVVNLLPLHLDAGGGPLLALLGGGAGFARHLRVRRIARQRGIIRIIGLRRDNRRRGGGRHGGLGSRHFVLYWHGKGY